MSYRDDTETRLARLERDVNRLPLTWQHLVICVATALAVTAATSLSVRACDSVEEAPEPAYDWRTDQTAVACHAACTAAGFRGVRYELMTAWSSDVDAACVCGADAGLVVLDVHGQRLRIVDGCAWVLREQR